MSAHFTGGTSVRRVVFWVVALGISATSWNATTGNLSASERSTTATVEGFTEPVRKVELAPAEPGTLAELMVKEGDTVQAGQVLAALENDVLRVAREIARLGQQAHGQLDAAAAELRLRQARFEKLEALRQRTHASSDEVERARTEVAVAAANLQTAREQRAINELEVQRAEAQIARRVLRSPFAGVVTLIHKEVGEYVPANAPQVMTVVQLDPLRVIFNLPTVAVAELSVGQTVELTLGEGAETVPARVELVSPVTEADSGTVRVKLLLDNSAGKYRAGLRATFPLAKYAQLTATKEPPPRLSLP